MGAPNNNLIPIAILYLHPGITKEEYVCLLDNTISGYGLKPFCSDEVWLKLPWHRFANEDPYFHEGLHGLAELLMINITESYKAYLQQEQKDEHGIALSHPSFIHHVRKIKSRWKISYEVTEELENKLDPPEIIEGYSMVVLTPGEIYGDYIGQGYLIEHILQVRKYRTNEPDDEPYWYRMQARRISCRKVDNQFDSLEQLTARFPQFAPEKMYNFSQPSGGFKMVQGVNYPARHFRWKMANGKYYLDEQTFERLPPCWTSSSSPITNPFYSESYGYTDLVVTAEALRHKAWKVFSWQGYITERVVAFLESFPEASRAHASAVWDSFTSYYAKQKGMTNTEFLRMRLLPFDAK